MFIKVYRYLLIVKLIALRKIDQDLRHLERSERSPRLIRSLKLTFSGYLLINPNISFKKLDYLEIWSKFSFTGQKGDIRIYQCFH